MEKAAKSSNSREAQKQDANEIKSKLIHFPTVHTFDTLSLVVVDRKQHSLLGIEFSLNVYPFWMYIRFSYRIIRVWEKCFSIFCSFSFFFVHSVLCIGVRVEEFPRKSVSEPPTLRPLGKFCLLELLLYTTLLLGSIPCTFFCYPQMTKLGIC